MYNTEHCGIQHIPNKNYCDCVEMNDYQAKQCALIAVDEIITAIENVFTKSVSKLNSTYRYYQEVKTEIEKL
jgi:predicted ATP-dependent protease